LWEALSKRSHIVIIIFKSCLLLWTKQETMSLLYTKNKENDLLNMLAAKVHSQTYI